MDAISRKYTGEDLPWRSPEARVVLVIEAVRAVCRKLPFTHTPAK